MFATAFVVFREVLEAALIISIVMAACQNVPGRGGMVGVGIGAGAFGSAIAAVFASAIADAAAGMGQELLNATILLLAVAMLGWHSIWMSKHGRELTRQIGNIGKAVSAGSRPLYALAVVIGVAVLREGAETVLFLFGVAAGGGNTIAALLGGGLLGLAAGVGSGAALYFGLLRIPLRHLFTVTNWMVLLIAAGMASQAAGFLVQAGILPPLGSPLWDTTAVISESSVLGKVLHALIGYVSRPAGVQLLFFLLTLGIIGFLTRALGKIAQTADASHNPMN
jgi:high-affinity iron transporter